VKFEFDAESPMLKLGQDLAFARGLSQDEFVEQVLVPYVQDRLGDMQLSQTEADEIFKTEKTKLGEKADARIEAATAYLTKNLQGDQLNALLSLTTSAAGVEAVEALMNKSGAPKINTNPDAGPQGKVSQEDLDKLMSDPKYWRDKDPAVIAKVTDGFKQLHGGEQQRRIG
jgi:hypothetical protein